MAKLFPRIESSDRDQGLEEILRKHIVPTDAECLEYDLSEASRRLREAVRHDAYLRLTPLDTRKFASLFDKLRGLKNDLDDLEAHNYKNFLQAMTIGGADQVLDLLLLHDRLSDTLADKDRLWTALQSVPTATAGTTTTSYSLVQRLEEAWKVISAEAPHIYQSSGARVSLGWNTGATFEMCLQEIGDHLELKTSKGGPFLARSAIEGWTAKQGAKRPAPDKI